MCGIVKSIPDGYKLAKSTLRSGEGKVARGFRRDIRPTDDRIPGYT